jgi:hypothetical protein
VLIADGLNLAGIRRVLQLQEEPRQLHAEVAGSRNSSAANTPRRRPRPRLLAQRGLGIRGAGRERLLLGRGLLRLLHIALDRLCLLPRRHLSRPEATDGRQPHSTCRSVG